MIGSGFEKIPFLTPNEAVQKGRTLPVLQISWSLESMTYVWHFLSERGFCTASTFKVTGAARLYRAASREQSERG
jgi:hypothetical protein